LELSNQAIGRAGEFQAASIFEQYGVVTSHVDVYSVDLWAETPTGRRVTVQVKTTLKPHYVNNRAPRYHFALKGTATHKADVVCFVALDLGLVRLLSSAELNEAKTKCHPATGFTEKAMSEDIKRYLY
jgi:hypothetical protein